MLRDYQKKAVEDVYKSDKKNILLQMPTGAGKTFTFCEIAKYHFIENVTKVLILVHRQELLDQAQKSLGEKAFAISKGVKVIPGNYDYYVGMVETVNRRLSKLPKFGMVIIDECHVANFNKMPFFEDENVKVIGVTATPIATEPLSKYYNEMIIPTSIENLINKGFLLNCDVYGVASDVVALKKFKTKMGEFDEKELEDFYSSEKMVKNVIEAYWKYSAGKKTLIFNVNVKHNAVVCEALRRENLNVYEITGDTPNREKIIKEYSNDPHGIMCNVGVLTTGFDEPSIQTIILNRATKSLALYLQMIGRGSRLHESKEKFTIIDLGRNTPRHGFYDDFFDWETYFRQGKKKDSDKVGAAPIKECPECNFMMHTRKIVCENCGHDFVAEREAQEQEEQQKELYLLTKSKPMDVPIDSLFNIAEIRGWKPYAVIYKIADHVFNYYTKHSPIVTQEYCKTQMIGYLEMWCKKYEKPFNKWHRDFALESLSKKFVTV